MRLNDCGVKLIEAPYRHYTDGKREYKGITGYIGSLLFPEQYSSVPERVLNAAKEFGSEFHHLTQIYDVFKVCEIEEVKWYAEAMRGYEVIGSEYVVTDFNYFASPIDRVLIKDSKVYLADIKTTYNINTDYLRWQLSILTHLFNFINPSIEVSGLLAIWLNKRKKRCEIIPIEPIAKETIVEFLECAKNGVKFNNPLTQLQPTDANALALVTELSEVLKEIKRFKQLEKELKDQIEMLYNESGLVKWETEEFTITRTKDYERESLDSKALKEAHPELYAEFVKITNVKGSVKITIK